eukprot:COSAG04_NODE_12904_length_629_cov_1.243396_1_plen_30_part_10
MPAVTPPREPGELGVAAEKAGDPAAAGSSP